MRKKLATLTLITCIFLAYGVHAPANPDTSTADEDSYVQVSLAAIERWERLLYDGSVEFNEVDTNALTHSLLEDLTRLYEVTKLPTARAHILKLLKAYEVSTRYGFSADGSLAASIARLELKNPVFDDYSLFLVNVENRSGVDLRIADWRFTLAVKDGAILIPDTLAETHPLHMHVKRGLAGFSPPETLKAGSTASLKLVFSRSGLTPSKMKYFRADLDDMRVVVKFYENLN
jgi:hypothetical protein